MRPAIVLVAAIVFHHAVGIARAAEPDADGLITRGLELRRESKPEQALEMFQRAHALAPSPRTLGQMGLVETSLEHWMDAEAHLTASLATPDDTWVRKNRAFLDQALAVCKGHIGELVITGPDGTNVAVDGKSVGVLPAVQPVRLAEGNAAVTASGTGFKDFSKTVTVAGGSRTSLAIVLDPIDKRPAVALGAPVPLPTSSAASSPVVTEHHRPAWRSWAGPGLVAAGAGLLTWGIIWIAVDGNDHCPTGGPACNNVYDTKTSGWILAAGGAAAAAGGAVLLLTGRRNESPNVALAATPTSLLLRGRF
jgi:PEGA domain-containing protein